MLDPHLIWVETPGLEDLDPAAVARAAGVRLNKPGDLADAAVVTAPRAQADEKTRFAVQGIPCQWLDLAGEVGGGDNGLRQARAVAAVARAAGRVRLGTMAPVYAAQAALVVLVAGAGLAALSAAYEAAALGHPVLLATPGEDALFSGEDDDPKEVSLLAAQLPAGVEVAPRTGLAGLSGGAGDFKARLRGPRGAREERFGAVVIAPPGRWQSLDGELGIADGLFISSAQVDAERISGAEGDWFHAAVLAGVSTPAPDYAFASALALAESLQERPFTQATLFYTEARISAAGGERAFRRAREKGVFCARVDEGGLKVSRGGSEFFWLDPILDEHLELAPHLVTAAGAVAADLPPFLSSPELWPSWEELIPDHARFSGGLSAVSGLYVIGAARGTAPGEARRVEAAACAAELHSRLTGRAVPIPAWLDGKCARCLTCVRACPHGVPRYEKGRMAFAPAACLECGICAAECPGQAVTPQGWSILELNAALNSGLAAAPDPKILFLACSKSATPAFYELSRAGHAWPAGLLLLPLPCAGRAGEELILKGLEAGAEKVLVAGCHQDNCRSLTGNRRAKQRSRGCAESMAALKLNPDRVRFLNLASNQPELLARVVEEMARG